MIISEACAINVLLALAFALAKLQTKVMLQIVASITISIYDHISQSQYFIIQVTGAFTVKH